MLYDRAGLNESFGAYALFYHLSPSQFVFGLLFLIYFKFLSRFTSYTEGNVEFKCGDGKLSFSV
ncbi:hypothetical protein Hanom_Chr06g00544241 [Helianthus anomalus]